MREEFAAAIAALHEVRDFLNHPRDTELDDPVHVLASMRWALKRKDIPDDIRNRAEAAHRALTLILYPDGRID